MVSGLHEHWGRVHVQGTAGWGHTGTAWRAGNGSVGDCEVVGQVRLAWARLCILLF